MRIDILKKIRKDESGATAIEYGLIAALVSVAAIGALTAMGNSLNQMFTLVTGALTTSVAGYTDRRWSLLRSSRGRNVQSSGQLSGKRLKGRPPGPEGGRQDKETKTAACTFT